MFHSIRNSSRPFASPIHVSCIIVCFVFLLAGLFALNNYFLYTPDSARYLIWAKSLSSFEGFKDSTSPETIRYVMHSPFYSILLSPIALFFPLNVVAAKIWTLLIGVITLLLFSYWLTKAHGTTAAFLGCFFLAINPLFLLYSTEILSDVPFVACMTLVFILLDRMTIAEQTKSWLFVGIVLAISAGVLAREIGFSLLASVTLLFLSRKNFFKAAFSFFVPVLLFGIWFIRNELIVAPSESPSLTYSGIITHHFFTVSNASLWQEFLARAANNVGIYGKLIGSLIFFPLYESIQFDVVARDSGVVASISSFLGYGKYFLILLTAGFGLRGVYLDYHRLKSAPVRLLFLLFYLMILLFYPIYDVRLLLPMLILMLYYFAIGCSSIVALLEGKGAFLLRVIPVFVVLSVAVPNVVWDGQLLANNFSYAGAPGDTSQVSRSLPKYPLSYSRSFQRAGEWIVKQGDSSVVVLSKWKELACWLEGRKLFSVDENISLDVFERLLRDYNIRYVVTSIREKGWRDFEMPIDLTRKFSFSVAHRIGTLEILRVLPGTHVLPERDTVSYFRDGLYLLNQLRYRDAEKAFSYGVTRGKVDFSTMFYTAVAQEFAFKLDEADSRFSTFHELPVSGYLDDAAVHHDIIGLLSAARQAPFTTEKAELYFRAAGSYWDLGFRSHARLILRMSLQADSTFIPAYIFGIHFALEENDTAEAKLYYRFANHIQPQNGTLNSFSNILRYRDSLQICKESKLRSADFFVISQSYYSIGLVESAIDNALQSVREDSANIESLRFLVMLYNSRQRYAPARTMVEHALRYTPEDAALLKEHEELQEHF